MKFEKALSEGVFLSRYKRFFADLMYEDQKITAHVPNSGSMKGCQTADSPCLFSKANDPKRKLQYTLEGIQVGDNDNKTWVGVNTSRPNALVEEAFQNHLIKDWVHFEHIAREVKISDDSRVDLVLWNGELPEKLERPTLDIIRKSKVKFHFIEVKNVSMAEGSKALFPDSVTTRGQKHIRELMSLIEKGHSAEFVFIIQRTDVKSFAPADDIDPEYGKLLRQAYKKGLGIRPLIAELSTAELKLGSKSLKINL